MTALLVADTSALVAVLQLEDRHDVIRAALATESFIIPTPAFVEFWRVARRGQRLPVTLIDAFLAAVLTNGLVAPFDEAHARAAVVAAEAHGTGNGRGGLLNLCDLMVYAVAKVEELPILCTGNDFASTDIAIHPASRVG